MYVCADLEISEYMRATDCCTRILLAIARNGGRVNDSSDSHSLTQLVPRHLQVEILRARTSGEDVVDKARWVVEVLGSDAVLQNADNSVRPLLTRESFLKAAPVRYGQSLSILTESISSTGHAMGSDDGE